MSSLEDVVLFALFAYGFAFGLQYKAIPALMERFEIPKHGMKPDEPRASRYLRGLGSCAYCSGFWGGVAWLLEPHLPRWIVLGLAGAALSYMVDRWTD